MNYIILPIQIVLLLFLVFAVSRVILRYRESSLSFGSFIFWLGVWILAAIAIMDPSSTTIFARSIGIQRGADVILYFSIALLFYLIFRTNILIENLKEEITRLTRIISLKKVKNKKKE